MLFSSLILLTVAVIIGATLNPVLMLALVSASIAGIGCGLSRVFNDEDYFESSKKFIVGFVGVVVAIMLSSARVSGDRAAAIGVVITAAVDESLEVASCKI